LIGAPAGIASFMTDVGTSPFFGLPRRGSAAALPRRVEEYRPKHARFVVPARVAQPPQPSRSRGRAWPLLPVRTNANAQADSQNTYSGLTGLNRRLPDNLITTADSGSATNWWARQLALREGMMASLSGTLATMVPGVPYAIAAKFAHPDRPVIAFAGDGAFEMLGMNELITVKRYVKELCSKNPTLIFAVLVNEDLNQVSYEQRVLSADPKNPSTQDVPYIPAAEFARMLGFEGIKIEKPADVGPAWDRALAHDGPVLLEFITDAQIPPLPPHVKPAMLKKTMKGLMHHDEDAKGIAVKRFNGKMSELKDHLPGAKS
jgi:pyruvate dehydrogenase (quinone)